jgi:hypothetical protein
VLLLPIRKSEACADNEKACVQDRLIIYFLIRWFRILKTRKMNEEFKCQLLTIINTKWEREPTKIGVWSSFHEVSQSIPLTSLEAVVLVYEKRR